MEILWVYHILWVYCGYIVGILWEYCNRGENKPSSDGCSTLVGMGSYELVDKTDTIKLFSNVRMLSIYVMAIDLT